MIPRSFFILILCFFQVAQTCALEVVEFSPLPNYALSVDEQDIQQLTDGKVSKGAIWTKKSSVGWNKLSPVSIRLHAEKTDANRKIRIHSSANNKSGVRKIQRVDIYGSDEIGGMYVHLGEYQATSNNGIPGTYTIDVDVARVTQELVIVLHTQSGGIFIDEIQMVKGAPSPAPLGASPVLEGDQLINHSNRRLKKFYNDEKKNKLLKIKRREDFSGLEVGRINCFDRELDKSAAAPFNDAVYLVQGMKIRGQLCFSVDSDKDFDMTIGVERGLNSSLYQIKKQLLRNGQHIYDALIKVGEGDSRFKGGEKRYFWLDFDGDDLDGGSSSVITVANSHANASISLEIESRECNKKAAKSDVNVWAYSLNNPIWNDGDKVKDSLIEEGVNIYTVHPHLIPSLVIGRKPDWSKHKVEKLQSEIRSQKEGSIILLINAWKDGRNLSIDSKGRMSKESERDLLKWVKKFTQFVEKNNFDYQNLLLAPIDEPFGSKLNLLKEIVRVVAKENTKIRFYANPILSRVGSAQRRDLMYLESSIGYWQPSYEYAIGPGNDYFGKYEQRWAIYQVPKYPAKWNSPGGFYRALAWKAWALGASGIGTWSFDDTQGSLAFDDFDGPRSDWALVYESSDGPYIPSRRWYSLLRGVEDIQLRNYWHSDADKTKQGILNSRSAWPDFDELFQDAMKSCLGNWEAEN